MSTIKALQGWRFKFAYGAENESAEEGNEHYKISCGIDVSKTTDGKPIKIYSQHNAGKFVDHLFWQVRKDELEGLKNFLESKGKTKYENGNIESLDKKYPPIDIQVEVDNVCHPSLSGSFCSDLFHVE